MKHSIYILLIVAAAVTGYTWHSAYGEEDYETTKSLTIRECIARALSNNLEIKLERINPTIASWGVVREEGAFDPSLTLAVQYGEDSRPLDPQARVALGLDSIDEDTLDSSLGLTGLLPTGTRYALTAVETGSKGTLSSNRVVQVGTGSIALTQPLLKNFGTAINLANIRIARKNHDITKQAFAQQVMITVSTVINTYYELLFDIENHKAKIEDLNRAKKLLEENTKRVEVGVMSPLDVIQAEAGVAEREEAVIVARQDIRERENVMKRLISHDVMEFHHVRLMPVEYPLVEMVDLDDMSSTRTALENRPDYLQAIDEVDRRQIVVKFTKNQLFPQIDLEGSYGLNARAGSDAKSADFGDFVSDFARADNPVWTIGIAITVPLGNREARSDHEAALLEAQKALLELKTVEQNIFVEVDNTVGRVKTNLKRIEATRAASRLARESLKAEEKRLQAGTSTSFLVLQAQAILADARSSEIRAHADYSQSLVDLALVEGSTLKKYDIVLDEDH